MLSETTVHVYEEPASTGMLHAPIGEIHSARDGIWYRVLWFLIRHVTPKPHTNTARARFNRFWLKWGQFTHVTMMLSVLIAVTAVLVYAFTDPIYADVRAQEFDGGRLPNILIEYEIRKPGDYAMSALTNWRPATALLNHTGLYESGWIGHRTVVFSMSELAREMVAADAAECVCGVHYGLHVHAVRVPGGKEIYINPAFKYRFGGDVTYPWFAHAAIDPFLHRLDELVAPRESAVSYTEVGGAMREKKMDTTATACFAYCEALIHRLTAY
jgi:hypothetical protein